jgi:hypothetical protein
MLPVHDDLDAVSRRRELLGQAIIGLEDALTTSEADGAKWRLRVAMAVDHAVVSIEEHIRQAEADDGFLDRVGHVSPRLARRANQLCVDHERLVLAANALRRAVDDVDEAHVGRHAPGVRKLAVEVINQLTGHRERSAELVSAYRRLLEEPGSPLLGSTQVTGQSAS